MVVTALRIVADPLTLFLEVESAIGETLQVPLSRNALLVADASVVYLMGALVLLDKVNRAGCSVVAEDLELTNGVMTLALDFASLDLEFLDSHLLTFSILLVPAFPDAHLSLN